MTDSQRREIERHLEDALATLRLQASIGTDQDMYCADENEFASRLSEMRMNVTLQARIVRQIRLLEDARHRLSVADYGTCDECGEDIPVSRLKANPATRLCVHCQQEVENAPAPRVNNAVALGLSA